MTGIIRPCNFLLYDPLYIYQYFSGPGHKDISLFGFTVSLDVLGELEGLMGEEIIQKRVGTPQLG